MSVQQTSQWTCDLCGKTKQAPGENVPEGWHTAGAADAADADPLAFCCFGCDNNHRKAQDAANVAGEAAYAATLESELARHRGVTQEGP